MPAYSEKPHYSQIGLTPRKVWLGLQPQIPILCLSTQQLPHYGHWGLVPGKHGYDCLSHFDSCLPKSFCRLLWLPDVCCGVRGRNSSSSHASSCPLCQNPSRMMGATVALAALREAGEGLVGRWEPQRLPELPCPC